jgi:hypothetical protein
MNYSTSSRVALQSGCGPCPPLLSPIPPHFVSLVQWSDRSKENTTHRDQWQTSVWTFVLGPSLDWSRYERSAQGPALGTAWPLHRQTSDTAVTLLPCDFLFWYSFSQVQIQFTVRVLCSVVELTEVMRRSYWNVLGCCNGTERGRLEKSGMGS